MAGKPKKENPKSKAISNNPPLNVPCGNVASSLKNLWNELGSLETSIEQVRDEVQNRVSREIQELRAWMNDICGKLTEILGVPCDTFDAVPEEEEVDDPAPQEGVGIAADDEDEEDEDEEPVFVVFRTSNFPSGKKKACAEYYTGTTHSTRGPAGKAGKFEFSTDPDTAYEYDSAHEAKVVAAAINKYFAGLNLDVPVPKAMVAMR